MNKSGEKVIKDYEDLVVWKKADELAHEIFLLTKNFPKRYLFSLTIQIERAVLSIPTNIAEGSASIHSRGLVQFLNISCRSAYETKYLLNFAYQELIIEEKIYRQLVLKINEIIKMLKSLINSIGKQERQK